MNKAELIDKLEDIIQRYRKELAENENSTMSNIADSFSMGFQSLKASMSGDDDVKHFLEGFKDKMSAFEKAIKNDNRQLAVQMLDDMETYLRGFKARNAAPVI